MSKVLKVEQGGYTVKVQSGQDIVFDTARGNKVNNRPTGNVVIRGNLEVEGNTITVESSDLKLNDNLITLNRLTSFESATAGIPAAKNYQGGVEIERGSLSTAQFLFDEQINWNLGGTSGSGLFRFKTAAGTDLPIYTAGIKSPGDLYVTPGGVINVTNTTDYEKSIFNYSGSSLSNPTTGGVYDDDKVPNAKAVVDYVQWFQTQNSSDATIANFDSSVVVSDGSPSTITHTIDGNARLIVYDDRTEFNSAVKISSNEISSVASNTDLKLSANGTGEIFVNDILRITESTDPAAPTTGIKLYSKRPQGGDTGIYFVNKNEDKDELISRKRAMLYSLMF